MIQSPIRWIGGKTKLLHEIRKHYPKEYGTYFEPFLGGAAVLLDICPERAIVSDKNEELINFYEQIRDNCEAVCELCQSFSNDEKTYYDIRSWDRKDDFYQLAPISRAARFLYLNKTSFQGLWRENKNGQYNAAYGKIKVFNVDRNRLFAVSKAIRHVYFSREDYKDALLVIKKDDFVYLDPPYIPISATSSFTRYTVDGFDDNNQVQLRDYCRELHQKGARFLLSNSDCQRVRELYSDFTIQTIDVLRNLSAKVSSRGMITEVLIKNYP